MMMNNNTQVSGYVVADVEGTLTSGVMWEGIAQYLTTHQQALKHYRFLLANLPGMMAYKFGLVNRQNFKVAWVERQAKSLAGFTENEMNSLCKSVVENVLFPNRFENMTVELREWHARGATIILATGLFQPMTRAFADSFDFKIDHAVGTPLDMENGIFTGKFTSPVCNGYEKARRVKQIIGESELLTVYSDSISDLPLFELGKKCVAVFPEKELEEYALSQGWRVIR
jgi:HAD superfamily phosphoserine phosphatase-like hydrolase